MIFSYFTSIASNAMVCRKSDFERLTHSDHVRRCIAAFRKGDANAKKNLPSFCFHASFPHGHRKAAEALASGLFMLDFDHLTEEELKQLSEIAVPTPEQQATSPILLVHITPSGRGLRIVAKAIKTGSFATCESISDYQHALAKILGFSEKLDEVTTDLSRLSFVPQAEDVLYLSDRLFNEAPEVTSFKAVTAAQQREAVAIPTIDLTFPDSSQTTYDGVPLKDIFLQYLMDTGGMPQEGSRNSRYYAAARDLRYICDFNPRVIARYLPDCGLSASEVFQVCASACQSARATSVPVAIKEAISTARIMMEEETPEEEEAEANLEQKINEKHQPRIVREFLQHTPPDFREATLLALLPVCGTLATALRSRYLDGEIQSPSFFCAVSSEQASGKSFARRLVRILLSSIAEEDAQQRAIEQEYHKELRKKKNSKDQPEEPRTKIRLVPASISIAKLLQRLDYANGEHLFSFTEEMDTIIKTNRGGAWSEKNDLYRNAFDNSEYGQDYMSETSYSANLPVYYNMLVLGTPRQNERFFADVENGLVSRVLFAFIPDQFAAKMPVFEKFNAKEIQRLNVYVKKLRAAKGEVNLHFVNDALARWLEEQRLQSLRENNHARDVYRRRSSVIGFRAALTFSPLYDLTRENNQQQLSLFAVEIATIVLRNQLAFAGPALNAIIAGKSKFSSRHKATDVFNSLPNEFTKQQLQHEMIVRGMKSPSRVVSWLWLKNGLIKQTEKGFIKIS